MTLIVSPDQRLVGGSLVIRGSHLRPPASGDCRCTSDGACAPCDEQRASYLFGPSTTYAAKAVDNRHPASGVGGPSDADADRDFLTPVRGRHLTERTGT